MTRCTYAPVSQKLALKIVLGLEVKLGRILGFDQDDAQYSLEVLRLLIPKSRRMFQLHTRHNNLVSEHDHEKSNGSRGFTLLRYSCTNPSTTEALSI